MPPSLSNDDPITHYGPHHYESAPMHPGESSTITIYSWALSDIHPFKPSPRPCCTIPTINYNDLNFTPPCKVLQTSLLLLFGNFQCLQHHTANRHHQEHHTQLPVKAGSSR
ncbi:hypothetical protein CPB84DRAFT_1398195 [Gymnopilus junonius]|uniref:Uncharacterized protein n=1 Tax=Gymnopilus junonius TaxID=109634 RepID=A0A9P5NGX4_GYMJU|nr:hypothetical protein CPB84DRAFT_1398195 [Gymnopilus junonius]